MKKRRAKACSLVACGLSLSVLAGCSLLPKEIDERKSPVIATQEPFEYKPDIVQRETIYDQVLLYPNFTETGGASLTFSEQGVVGEIYVTVGDRVKTGDLLAELDYVKEVREELEKVEEDLDAARLNLEKLTRQKDWDLRADEIRRKYKLISKADYEKAVQSVEQQYNDRIQDIQDQIYLLEIAEKKYQDQIERGTIRSTIDGIISTLRSETVGKYVENTTTFVQVVDNSVGMFELETEYASYFTVGQEVALESSSSIYYDTVVESVEGDKVLFKPNSDQIISLKSTTRLFLVLDQRENVLTLSKSSIRYTDDATYVYVLDDNGFRTMKEVTVGLEGGPAETTAKNRIEIVSGLEQGDIVIGR